MSIITLILLNYAVILYSKQHSKLQIALSQKSLGLK